MKRSCETCMFFDSDHPGTESGEGLCRGVPPTVHLYPGEEKYQAVWPTVRKDDWCGTWQAEPPSGPAVAGAYLAQ